MYPEPQAPAPGNNYDFIMNPQKPQRRGLFGGVKGDPFIAKIAVILGGAVVLIIILAVVVNVFFGGKTSTDSLVALVQNEQEIVRLSEMGETASSQQIKNAAINTFVSVKSHQRQWVAFLEQSGREVKEEEMELKKDATIDTKLKNAEQTSTFDTTYAAIMRSQLETYATDVKNAYNGSSNQQEHELLNAHFQHIALLLKQWPAAG